MPDQLNRPPAPQQQRLGLDVSPAFLRLLDAWRLLQPGSLSEIDAIRRLAARGRLEATRSRGRSPTKGSNLSQPE